MSDMLSTLVRFAAIIALASLSAPVQDGWFGPSDWADCALTRMPGTRSDVVASQVMTDCYKRFPPATTTLATKLGMNARECAVRYGRNTVSQVAAENIATACAATFPG
jgi:hypothetical protein